MKKIMLILLMIFTALYTTTLFAHPPKDILITFDKETSTLKVDIIHDVKDPITHHIDKVIVSLNGNAIITQLSTTQTDKNDDKLIYVIPAAVKGDKIEVKAYCNISGALKKEILLK